MRGISSSEVMPIGIEREAIAINPRAVLGVTLLLLLAIVAVEAYPWLEAFALQVRQAPPAEVREAWEWR